MSDNSDEKWEALRMALAELARKGEHEWWDETEILDIALQANRKGLSVDLVRECREACRSHEEFVRRLRELAVSGRPVTRQRHRVLAVDDEVEFLELVKANLERGGVYDVRTEWDPSGVVAAALEFQPELILMDVVMPGVDGLGLLEQIREHGQLRKIPVIMLTALADATPSGGVAMDGVLFLSKPIKLKRLTHCIDEHLRAASGDELPIVNSEE